jgi:hypothetical protein
MAALNENSYGMGVLAITMAASAASIRAGAAGTTDSAGAKLFTAFPVRSCMIQMYSGTTGHLHFGAAATAAATSFKFGTTPVPIPIDDLAQLNVIAGNNEVIQLLYRL